MRQPPGPRRLLLARAAGLRPRARWWVLTAVVAVLWPLLELGARWGPSGLSAWLAAGFAGGAVSLPASRTPGLVLAVTLAVVLVPALAWALLRRRPDRGALGLGAGLIDTIPPPLALLSCVVALSLLAWATHGGPAAAGRSANAGLAGLTQLWSGWARRGALALFGISAVLGGLERLVSARRLWQGLHLTPAQARAQARGRRP